MSSEISPTENAQLTLPTKSIWNVHLKTSTQAYHLILEKAKRDERRVSYIVSKIVEAYYEENSKLKVI